jgi:hypothetical protein
MYNLNYTPTTLGVQREGKLYLGIREQKRLNTTALRSIGFHLVISTNISYFPISYLNTERLNCKLHNVVLQHPVARHLFIPML